MVEYMTIPEAAILWKTTPEAVRLGCTEHQISGAVRFGRSWLIPETEQRPPMAERREIQQAVQKVWGPLHTR